jgi:LysM repeat protein
MSDFSPLIPRGSLLEQQAKGRPHLRIALCIVAGHLVFLGGLLMQGCKRDDPGDLAGGTGLPTLELTNSYPSPLVSTTLPPAPLPDPAIRIPEEVTADPKQLPPLPDLPGARDIPQPQWEEVIESAVQEEPTPSRPAAATEHTVARGDTFYGLAQRYGVTASDIARVNPGVDATRLQVGQKLTIPAPRAEAPVVGGAGDGGRGVYVVKRGDTLTRIAQQHGITVQALKDMNGLVMDRIIIDQKLKVPAGSGVSTPRGN